MDFHGINTVGKIWLERINSKPVFNSEWEGRVIFALDNQTLSIGTSAGWIDIASATQGGITNPSVPIGGVILFYSNTVLPGYRLYTDDPTITDDLVYITKGSGAGDEAGGAAKVSGSWIQDTHVHEIRHTITEPEMPYHNHPPLPGVQSFMSNTGSSHGHGGDSYGIYPTTGYAGGSQQMSFNSQSGLTPASWRPKGRNFTLQEKL